MHSPRIVAIYAAILAVVFVGLTINVIRGRYRARASLGDGGDAGLQQAIRAHGNFAEFVPFALVILTLAELNGSPAWSIHALGCVLVLARLSHAWGITGGKDRLRFRQFGVIATFLVLLGGAVHAVIGG